MKQKIFILVIFIHLYSCKSNSPQQKTLEILNGEWAIDEFVYKQKEISDCFMLNLLSFYGDSISGLPTSFNFCDSINEKEFKAIKKVIYNSKDDIRIYFKTKNKFFQDTFKLTLTANNKSRTLFMDLESKETYIFCSKMYYDYSTLASVKEIINIKNID